MSEASKPCALIVCGPSGVGKGTLITRLLEEHPDKFGLSCSHTTRKPREGEKEGVHYHYVDRDFMDQEIGEGKFLEFAHVSSNIYGTSFDSVRKVIDDGKSCVLDIDMQGAEQVSKDGSIQYVGVFIKPPSFDTLEQRLRGRGTETEDQILVRLNTAKKELEFGETTTIFHRKIVNDDIDRTYAAFKEVALAAHAGAMPQ